ncbi:MAG: bifunctional diaminohydroxyphosphoribosylaminopyrimidine deaminase/5-amino-6-(5-phosphoribosylamino)uracil reductase RibD [Limisphaerales bacterium]
MPTDPDYMRLALRLARRGYGATSPNPMVGAVLVKAGRVIGRGWHRRAGGPHAEIEALGDAQRRNHRVRGATLYVTLEPCCTQGRTPPCTEAIIAARLSKVVAGATDPNPLHAGRGFALLRKAGLAVAHGVLAEPCQRLNLAFNHWIVGRTPLVTVKAAMTLDGKIATASGESKWITGEPARNYAMKLRQGADAILVGINTILADDPSLTVRAGQSRRPEAGGHRLRRIVLDSMARTPLGAKVASDDPGTLTTIVVGESAPTRRVAALAARVNVLVAPPAQAARRQAGPGSQRVDLPWLMKKLGADNVTSLLVEGGGEVNAAFLFQGLAQRIVFFYAPKVLGGRGSRPAVAGIGALAMDQTLNLSQVQWRRLGPDWLLAARVEEPVRGGHAPGGSVAGLRRAPRNSW